MQPLKTCTKCGVEKPLSEYRASKDSKDGKTWHCKSCLVAAYNSWKKLNGDRVREISRAYAGRNKDKASANTKRWRLENSEYRKTRDKTYNQSRKEITKIKARERRASSPKLRFHESVAANVRFAIKNGSKNGRHTFDVLGYSLEELKRHLEKQFISGMNWENHGRNGWHIDHIIPVDAHNFETPDDIDFKRCWALSNLRPLWALDNIIKKNKLLAPFQPSLALQISAI